MRRSRRGSKRGHEFGSSGEDSFVAVVVTKLTGALLIILVLTMVIMVLLPKGKSTLQHLAILPSGGSGGADEGFVELPSATIGEPYRVLFASEGGNEFIDFRMTKGEQPKGLNWIEATHGVLQENDPGYKTKVGLEGRPEGPARDYDFELVAYSAVDPANRDQQKWDEKDKVSSPKAFRIRVVPPTVKRVDEIEAVAIMSPAELPAARLSPEGVATVQLSAKGGVPPYSWKIEPGPTLPLDISPEGMVTARTNKPAVMHLKVSVASSESELLRHYGKTVTASRAFTWPVLPTDEGLKIVTPTELPSAAAGSPPYRVALAARGGTGTYLWSIHPLQDGKELPPFLKVEGGELVATPPQDAFNKLPYEFRIQVEDGQPGRDPVSKMVRLRVGPPASEVVHLGDPAARLKITTKENLPTATQGVDYRLMFAAQGGRPPYHWEMRRFLRSDTKAAEIDQASSGLKLAEEGWYSGVPALAGDCTLYVRVWDSGPDGGRGERTEERSFRLEIQPPLDPKATLPLRIVTPGRLPDAIEGVRYQIAFSASGGLPPYRWSLQGEIPKSFGFQSPTEGVLIGSPDAASIGSHEFMVMLADRRGSQQVQRLKLNLTVRAGTKPLRLLTRKLPDAALGQSYAVPVGIEGGEPPFTWSLVGELPEGLVLDEKSGLISGKPTKLTDKPREATVRVAQADGKSVEATIAVAVAALIQPAPLQILTNEVLPPASVGRKDYEVQLTVEGGIPPYKWQQGNPWPDLTAGRLALSPIGKLSNSVVGFPSAKTHLLSAMVSDARGDQATRQFRLLVQPRGTIPPPPPKVKIVSHETLPAAVAGGEYRCALSAEGGIAPFEWTLQGELPKGLKLEKGQIVGTPIEESRPPAKVTLAVRDSQIPQDTDTKVISLSVVPKFQTGKTRSDWWKYFGYAVLTVGYMLIKSMSDGIYFHSRQLLVNQGLIEIHFTQSGGSMSGTPQGLAEHSKIDKAHNSRTRLIRLIAVVTAVGYGYYLFG